MVDNLSPKASAMEEEDSGARGLADASPQSSHTDMSVSGQLE